MSELYGKGRGVGGEALEPTRYAVQGVSAAEVNAKQVAAEYVSRRVVGNENPRNISEVGINTAMTELLEITAQVEQQAQSIEMNIGIFNQPPRDTEKGPSPGGLRDSIMQTVNRLRRTCESLDRVNAHLVS